MLLHLPYRLCRNQIHACPGDVCQDDIPEVDRAWTAAVWIASIHSRIFPLGMSDAVLTETMGMTPFFTGTLLVTVRIGFVHSFSP